MSRALLLAIALACASGSASALDVPQGSVADARVKRIAYNEHDVVALYAYAGTATQVVLAPGEKVRDIASGFADGWEVADSGNKVYIKARSVGEGEEAYAPVPGEWDTNLILETDQRSYLFQLFLVGGKNGSNKLEYDPRTAYRIQFTYPLQEANAAAGLKEQQVVEDRLATASSSVRNVNYSMKLGKNSSSIAPDSAYDDGRFTYFTFAANREVPAVFLLGQDGKESMVNTHMTGDTLVVHRVVPQLVLRLGKQVVSVFNEAFDASGKLASDGTTVPGIARVLTTPRQNDSPAPSPMQAAAQRTASLAALIPPREAMPQLSGVQALGQLQGNIPPQGNSQAAVPAAEPVLPEPASTPPPSFIAVANAPVRATLEAWLPEDWTLAWDTKLAPRGTAVQSSGEFLDAVRQLFATRREWKVQVEARVYPNEKILQVIDAGPSEQPQLTTESVTAVR